MRYKGFLLFRKKIALLKKILYSQRSKKKSLVERRNFIWKEYGIQISVIVKNDEHFRYLLGVLPFYDNVMREEVEILG